MTLREEAEQLINDFYFKNHPLNDKLQKIEHWQKVIQELEKMRRDE